MRTLMSETVMGLVGVDSAKFNKLVKKTNGLSGGAKKKVAERQFTVRDVEKLITQDRLPFVVLTNSGNFEELSGYYD